MPNINYPINPNPGDIYSFNGSNWRFNGSAWVSILGIGPQGTTGPQGITGPQGDTGPAGDFSQTFQGPWLPMSFPLMGDIFTYQGETWLNATGLATGTPSVANGWSLIASRGTTGSQGPQGPTGSVPVADIIAYALIFG